MKIIKTDILSSFIPIHIFGVCQLDGLTRTEILKKYPKRKKTEYYLDKFNRHLLTLGYSFKQYCKDILFLNWPICPVSKEEVGYRFDGRGVHLSKFKRGKINKENCLAFKYSCEMMSNLRKGIGNPMFGKKPWNKGKDKRNPSVKAISESRKGMIFSDETKKRQSDSAKTRKIHGHTGHKHSQKTINKLRENTAKLWASGRFNLVSSIHIKVREFLKTLSLREEFNEEFQVKYFSMDFAFPKSKIAIECQGTYFHVDPRIYADGPQDAIQRRNFGRDETKRKICEKQEGWKIIPIWETEINDGNFKNILRKKLEEFNLIKI